MGLGLGIGAVAAEKKKDEGKKESKQEGKKKVQKLNPKLVAKGKVLWKSKICFTCHQTEKDDKMVRPIKAPSFVGGIWGRTEEVHVGIGGPIKKIKVDEKYFVESMKNPMAKIVKGYQPVMPPLPLTNEEIKALMEYVKSLGVPGAKKKKAKK